MGILGIIQHQQRCKTNRSPRFLFDLALGKIVYDADVNARGTILVKSTQLTFNADGIYILGRMADVRAALIQI